MKAWLEIEHAVAVHRCRCDLREGMSHAELLAFGGGCSMPWHCCPALDKYRRLVPREQEAA